MYLIYMAKKMRSKKHTRKNLKYKSKKRRYSRKNLQSKSRKRRGSRKNLQSKRRYSRKNLKSKRQKRKLRGGMTEQAPDVNSVKTPSSSADELGELPALSDYIPYIVSQGWRELPALKLKRELDALRYHDTAGAQRHALRSALRPLGGSPDISHLYRRRRMAANLRPMDAREGTTAWRSAALAETADSRPAVAAASAAAAGLLQDELRKMTTDELTKKAMRHGITAAEGYDMLGEDRKEELIALIVAARTFERYRNNLRTGFNQADHDYWRDKQLMGRSSFAAV
jgi:hypothetical protein